MTRSLVVLLLAVAGLTAAPPGFAQLEVRLAPGASELSFTLTLPAATGGPRTLAPRGAAWGLKPQVDDVRCDGEVLPPGANATWTAPASCSKVTWRVTPDAVPAEGADASEQRTLAVGGGRYVLLAEPTSMLRVQGDEAAGTIRAAAGSRPLRGATPAAEAGAFRVPPAASAPEFYVLGDAAVSQRQVGALAVSYVADDAARVQRLGLEAVHRKALSHLTKALPLPPRLAAADRSLLVLWLGVAESRGGAGGAAGSRSFVANYVLGAPATAARHAALTTMIVAHEQFHQLVDIVRSQGPAAPSAVWFEESLAQFYGLDALRAADPSAAARQVRAKYIDPQRKVEHGLLELNRRFQAGDQEVYELFYSQGATFWHEIDEALRAATGGRKRLHHFLGELLRTPLAPGGALAPGVVASLRAAGGAGVERALAKHLGS
jgi:hypothetical protein